MVEALARSPDHRLDAAWLADRRTSRQFRQEVRTGILLDAETIGLNHAKFDYTPDHGIVGFRDTFRAFNEPSVPVPPEVLRWGTSPIQMLAGHKFDGAAITAFVYNAVIVNAGFDRKLA